MEYPKIHSLWKRADNHALIPGDHSSAEFSLIKQWQVEEKIDGTNTRVEYFNGTVQFAGRTQNAVIQPHLLEFLQSNFTPERLAAVFPEDKKVCLYGEGYGHKIQSGDYYRKDVGFMLFDVLVDRWWFTRNDMRDIAQKLELPTPHNFGLMTEDEIVKLIASKIDSPCSIVPHGMEGVICRPEPLMLYRNGKPLMWKLKVKDMLKLESIVGLTKITSSQVSKEI